MLKSVFPRRSKKRPLEHVTNDSGNFLNKADGEDEVINKFWLANFMKIYLLDHLRLSFCHDKKLSKESLRLVILAE
ncbi:unnamed protein product, partial [Brugia timori]|uniref:Ovule protein n=1 Tax=Brugia timori TaxID=42155 RepID=A0A0R3Q6Y0_9BILA